VDASVETSRTTDAVIFICSCSLYRVLLCRREIFFFVSSFSLLPLLRWRTRCRHDSYLLLFVNVFRHCRVSNCEVPVWPCIVPHVPRPATCPSLCPLPCVHSLPPFFSLLFLPLVFLRRYESDTTLIQPALFPRPFRNSMSRGRRPQGLFLPVIPSARPHLVLGTYLLPRLLRVYLSDDCWRRAALATSFGGTVAKSFVAGDERSRPREEPAAAGGKRPRG